MAVFLDDDERDGVFAGRVWRPDVAGPSVVTIRDGMAIDITSRDAPLVADICDMDEPAAFVRNADGVPLGSIDAIAANTPGEMSKPHFLAPCDLQVIKACGVTFASSPNNSAK